MTSHSSLARRTAGSARVARLPRSLSVAVPLLAALLVGLLPVRAPQPAGPEAAAEAFSAGRAMEKVGVIAREPHPAGSESHERVRDYLLSELESLGLQPEVQRTEAESIWEPGRRVSIDNIVTRIPGTDSGKAVLIMAHYDTVPGSPGAGDNAAAVAAMLETARAVKASAPLRNDLLLLMTDGEEMGLQGAKAFVNEHPLARNVGLALNFDARGNMGPSFMFETSDRNGWLIREFVRAAPHPLAYSLIYNIYQMLPNDTDLSILLANGLPGMNFVFGLGLHAYHREIDTPDRLDRSSLQHHGSYMLSLARHFGQIKLEDRREENRIYFNVLGRTMVSYPESGAVGLALLGALLYAGTALRGIRRRRLTLGGIGAGFVLSLVGAALAYAVVALVWPIARERVSAAHYTAMLEHPSVSTSYFLGLLALAAAVAVAWIRLSSRRLGAENLWAGTLLLWTLLSAGTAFCLPSGSYLIIWPLIFSLIGLNASLSKRGGTEGWVAALSAAPAIALFAPVVYLAFVMLTLERAEWLVPFGALAWTLAYPAFCRRPSSASRAFRTRSNAKRIPGV
ncbi:M20/M25/M40 family metallo-hydrolase [Cohnella hongkongensis]|uniref:M20/M25/M40 family metallo-hydrolase n=1 Tax=Cohnella hongkongensis TaxID=178337 RepID=A0ABV9FAA9_9BACL